MVIASFLFASAASFLVGMIFVDFLWDIGAFEKPYTEETWAAISGFYTNNVVGTRRRAWYLILPFPGGFAVVIGSLAYLYFSGASSGNRQLVVAAEASMLTLFPLMVLAVASTFPTIASIIEADSSMPLAGRHVCTDGSSSITCCTWS